MPSGALTDADKATVKRIVPKPSNKVRAAAVARLYICFPNSHKWIYTGLQGAVVFAEDHVGNTFWIKLVDISGSNRGVLWDQEIYDPFYYNQDRTFFHSFELEECLAGLSFVNEKEAKQFKKKVDKREENASKEIRGTQFQQSGQTIAPASQKSHSRFGLGNLLQSNQRHSSAPSIPPPQPLQSTASSQNTMSIPQSNSNRDRASSLDTSDPSWQNMIKELLNLGLTEDQIVENHDFIKNFIEQQQNTNGEQSSHVPAPGQHPPSPPAPPLDQIDSSNSQHMGNTTQSRRGPAPAPPQPRRSRQENSSLSLPSGRRTPSPPEEQATTPTRPQYQFRAPPPFADAGKFANVTAPSLPRRQRAISNVANPGPPPPPRPPKTPLEDTEEPKPKFGVPPPFQGDRVPNNAPPPPPSRAPPSMPPRSRDTSQSHALPPAGAAPPLPPKQQSGPPTSSGPPPPPARNNAGPPPPPLPSAPRPQSNAPPPPPPPSAGAPPAPPLPPGGAPPPPPPPPPSSGGAPPPPPPMPSTGGPVPPPLPPGGAAGPAPALPKAGDRGDMLASIRASGGVGGGGLKKVSDKEKRDRSAAMVPGGESSAPAADAPSAPSGGGGGGLQDALAAALSKRNKKVSKSDDEDDDDDDW